MTSESLPSVPPPWTLKGDVYAFAFWTKASQDLPPHAYSPLEAQSSYASSSESGKHVGGFSMLQFIRYTDSPVGPYDEMILAPGGFEYEREDKDGRRVKRRNPRITRIYVSQKNTCYNGRKNWNVPKHLARFDWSEDSDGITEVKVYPRDVNSAAETTPSETPFFQATFKQLRFAPSFPFQTNWINYIGVESTLVLPPLPARDETHDELPGTDRWCAVVPRQWSPRCSLGWFDLSQHRDAEGRLTGEFENFWPGWGRWHLGFKMKDAVTIFDHPETWDAPRSTL
ncbi:hypothetical protein CEP51_004122 [Fusarium floridanum]|uniref:Uncharacterized protein n=1 Tax=Fusarium floridanum TaxID=1325733 RepID=A0A428S2P7_9HYPO|nr:hypothetical protein CEP51_004122 [Fusarium floridanum]